MLRIKVILFGCLLWHHASSESFGCDFDANFCGFNNSCPYKWQRSNSTSNQESGPAYDHTSGNGYYAYIDSSYPNYPLKGPFCLESPQLLGQGLKNAVFYYNMYGTDIGSLYFEVSNDGDSWNTLWSKYGVCFCNPPPPPIFFFFFKLFFY
jgi:hypothetical protein